MSNRQSWWEAAEADVAQELTNTVEALKNHPDHADREQRWDDYSRLVYSQTLNVDGDQGTVGTFDTEQSLKLSWNAMAAAVRTLLAKIGKSKPRIQVLPIGGRRKARKMARDLSTWLDGIFDLSDFNRQALKALADSLVFDFGAVKVFADDSRILCERLMPWNVFFDPVDAESGKPTCVYERRRMHPVAAAKLLGCEVEQLNLKNKTCCEVWEAWRLPQGDDPGRHVIVCGTEAYVDEEWEEEGFPIEIITWDERSTGAYGQGVAEQIMPLQAELNRGLMTISAAHHLVIKPRIFCEEGSEITGAISNAVGQVITYRGPLPIFATANGMPPESYNWVETCWRKIFEAIGLQLSSATGSRPPAGVDAAVAIREYRDIETERYAAQAQRFDEFYVRCGKRFVAIAKQLYSAADGDDKEAKKKADIVVAAPGTRDLRRIAWSELDLVEDHCLLRMWPVNSLPQTPAARRQFCVELFRDGLASRTQALSMLDIPDERLFLDRELAALEEAEFLVESMLDGEEYEGPDSFMDLEQCIYIAKAEYVRCRRDKDPDVSPRALESLRRFIGECIGLKAEMEAPPPAPPGSPGLPPVQGPAVVDPLSAPVQGLSAVMPPAS